MPLGLCLSLGITFPGNGAPVAGSRMICGALYQRLGAVSHSPKSPFFMRVVGTVRVLVAVCRRLAHSSLHGKKSLLRSALNFLGMKMGPATLNPNWLNLLMGAKLVPVLRLRDHVSASIASYRNFS